MKSLLFLLPLTHCDWPITPNRNQVVNLSTLQSCTHFLMIVAAVIRQMFIEWRRACQPGITSRSAV